MWKFLFAGMVVVSTGAVHAQAQFVGFCGNYVQLTSNAGDCLNCRLIIADNPKNQFYFVEANNGWTAELTWVDGDASVATGQGFWGDVGGAYDNAGFEIDLLQQGRVLTMFMTHHLPELSATIEATYACTD